jgi:hypothetical protein
MESVALSKGMSLSEFAKLKVRLDADATLSVIKVLIAHLRSLREVKKKL